MVSAFFTLNVPHSVGRLARGVVFRSVYHVWHQSHNSSLAVSVL